jgi:hypothetical protein
MKRSATLHLFLLLVSSILFAQPEKDFNKEEARDMIALCNSFSFLDLYGTDSAIIPQGYTKLYTSEVTAMDNVFQIYLKDQTAIINLRGSTAKKISWMENIYSAMIPARGVIEIQEKKFHYTFAKEESAAVHAGYTLGVALLQKDLLPQIKHLNRQGIFNFLITGHSQGGALASMLLAYLHHLPEKQLSPQNRFRCYAFAAPMIGNKAFTAEYNDRFCKTGLSFAIVNPADVIPTFPLSYKESSTISQGLLSLLLDDGSFGQKLIDGAFLFFDKNLGNTVRRFSTSVAKQISNEVGTIVMPPYVEDVNYYKLGNRIELFKAVYPKILKDSSILQNDSLLAIYPRASNGHFVNKELYRKEPMMYQHKPYNYYTSFLRKFFPEEYLSLNKKYLEENL